jgi:hypothetical protein
VWQNEIPVPDKLKLSAPELAIVRGFLAGKHAQPAQGRLP